MLIEAGADIDVVSVPGFGGAPSSTALAHAPVFGMTEVLDVLVAAGVRIGILEMAAAAGRSATPVIAVISTTAPATCDGAIRRRIAS